LTLEIEPLPITACDWPAMDAFPDRQVFQTRGWLAFLEASQGAEPVVCAVTRGGETVGYFTGAVVRRFGVRILGSPFPGWATGYMGFNLLDGVSRRDAAAAVMRHAFGPLRCVHVELRDRLLGFSDAAALGGDVEEFVSFELDMSGTEEQILGNMTSACRRAIRKSAKEGVTVVEAHDDAFAAEYHAQLQDVFAKQGLRPTYDVRRVEHLLEHLRPSGSVLCLRALDPSGTCIATGIFPGHGRSMYFWGGASWRSGQILRPNEAIFWHAIRHWKARGAVAFDLGGGGEYKRKYGGADVAVPHLVRSRYRALTTLRGAAERIYSVEGLRNRFRRPGLPS
jgi:CelD/BcsL family acetyltransferase involved in cellulose biosynthesis